MRRAVGREVREAGALGGEKMDEHAVAEVEADERHFVAVPRDGFAAERRLAVERHRQCGGLRRGVLAQPCGQRGGVAMLEIKGFAGGDDFAKHRQAVPLPVGETVRFAKPKRRQPGEQCDRRSHRPQPRRGPPRTPPADGRASENFRPQIRRHCDGTQMSRDRPIERLLLGEPCGERGIFFRRLDGRRENRVARVLPAWAVGAEKQPRLVAHAAPFPTARMGMILPSAPALASSRSWRSCALPRERRDITVPMGTSRMSAIS